MAPPDPPLRRHARLFGIFAFFAALVSLASVFTEVSSVAAPTARTNLFHAVPATLEARRHGAVVVSSPGVGILRSDAAAGLGRIEAALA